MMTINYALWDWPQWAAIALSVLGVIATAFLHGVPKTGNHNLGIFLFSQTITYFILIAGGFFS